MNCFSGRTFRLAGEQAAAASLALVVLALSGAASALAQDAELNPQRHYDAIYTLLPDPTTGIVDVRLEIRQARDLLREVRIERDPRLVDVNGDGRIDMDAMTITWQPPASGGVLTWSVAVEHRRNGDGFDAWLGEEWGVFRAEDVIPRAASRTLRGAHSRTRLVLRLPDGWSAVTEYMERDGEFRIENPARRFDQPTGWIAVGRIGVRREIIAGSRVAVAGPVGESIRRMDILALLNWSLPELGRLLPELPARMTVIVAGEPMWRGGLSAPRSLFLHASRPLLSENATSTLLHEVMHIALGLRAEPGYDWIVEGLAEYYSLELLRRSGTITRARHERARRDQAEWAEAATTLCARVSSGATTALAVTTLAQLDATLRRNSAGTVTLDDVARTLWGRGSPVNLAGLQDAVAAVAPDKPDVLHSEQLPGCDNWPGTG